MAETRNVTPWAFNGISLSSCWKTGPPCTAVAVHDLQKPMKAKIAPVSTHRAVGSSPPMTGPTFFFSILIEATGFNLFKLIFLRL